MKIIFIRHGETTGDVQNRYGGDYNDSLSNRGRKQVLSLKEELLNKGIEMVYSSPLIRARETAEILGYPIEANRFLKERNQYGILSGMTKEEAQKKYPELVEKIKDRMNTINGAESYNDFSERIKQGLNEIMETSTCSTIAVVWHGGPMRVLFRDILKLGELTEIGDCAWVEFEKRGPEFVRLDYRRLKFA